ncbi:uncharacterized protein CCR75_003334 [Bremia lactucae]|uniref:Tubulin-folding cofactor C n=1 Tax=Bremia lactucae TaxID=4779 RepID=A0A976IL13_BRELC|nr:hypothetical protein CCR75_003334 [Bremia lactucae]
MNTPVTIGMRCELLSPNLKGGLRASLKRYGEIAYIGKVSGLPGDNWIGVRLDKPLGKGDGSVQGKRYFDCKPLHGAIVPLNKININGDFPVITNHEESLAHALEKRRQEKQEASGSITGTASGDLKFYRERTTDELVTAFWKKYIQQEEHVRKQVALYSEQKKQPVACEKSKEVYLDALLLKVNDMRDAAASASSLYLSPYDTRQTQHIVAKLLELIDTTRTTFAPRKKFTFRAHAAQQAKMTEKRQNVLQEASTDLNKNQQPSSVAVKTIDELVYANKKNEVIIIDHSSFADTDNLSRLDLNFSQLSNCVVFVCVETSAIRGDTLTNCVFYTGAIFGSLWLEKSNNCDFFVACRQLRVHLSSATQFHLRISSHPIIEDCEQMQFGPYCLQFPGLKDQLEQLGVAKDSGLWAKVNDFKWHKKQQSPNWSLLDSKQLLPVIPVDLESRVSYT